MTDEDSQTRGHSERIPRPRIQTLSDLIFGLALSIGAISLISAKPTTLSSLAGSILGFGWAFVILGIVWVRYTRVMSVLPVDSSAMVVANMLLLLLVSIEPYLYNLISISFSSPQIELNSGITTTLYAIDMGSIFIILAFFTNQLLKQERKLIPERLMRSYTLQRNGIIVSAGLFLSSSLPLFWDYHLFGIQTRFIMWMSTFVISVVRGGLERRRSKGSKGDEHLAEGVQEGPAD